MTSPHLLAPPTAITTLSLMLAVPVNVAVQTEEAPSIDSPEQCALIDDGIKRLACFDSLYKPTESQAQASESAKEQAEKSAEQLAPNGKDLDAVAGSALEAIPTQALCLPWWTAMWPPRKPCFPFPAALWGTGPPTSCR